MMIVGKIPYEILNKFQITCNIRINSIRFREATKFAKWCYSVNFIHAMRFIHHNLKWIDKHILWRYFVANCEHSLGVVLLHFIMMMEWKNNFADNSSVCVIPLTTVSLFTIIHDKWENCKWIRFEIFRYCYYSLNKYPLVNKKIVKNCSDQWLNKNANFALNFIVSLTFFPSISPAQNCDSIIPILSGL